MLDGKPATERWQVFLLQQDLPLRSTVLQRLPPIVRLQRRTISVRRGPSGLSSLPRAPRLALQVVTRSHKSGTSFCHAQRVAAPQAQRACIAFPSPADSVEGATSTRHGSAARWIDTLTCERPLKPDAPYSKDHFDGLNDLTLGAGAWVVSAEVRMLDRMRHQGSSPSRVLADIGYSSLREQLQQLKVVGHTSAASNQFVPSPIGRTGGRGIAFVADR